MSLIKIRVGIGGIRRDFKDTVFITYQNFHRSIEVLPGCAWLTLRLSCECKFICVTSLVAREPASFQALWFGRGRFLESMRLR